MNILVTGGAGYLGSVLVPKLIARGHSVRVLDVGYFGVSNVHTRSTRLETIHGDIRTIVRQPNELARILDRVDCIIHLAAISNDPSAELKPELTIDVNLHSTEALAEKARAMNLRFIFSSSCSVYGNADGEIEENGAVNPLTVYAKTKVQAEQTLNELTNRSWRPIILRNGTLFGYSPRMRFDLVINIFCLYSALYDEIRVFGDGMQWRPFLHVSDCARAFVYFAEHPEPEHSCYNVAHENMRVVDLAHMFRNMNPCLRVVTVNSQDEDRRDYAVATTRLGREGFETKTDIRTGAEALIDAISTGAIRDPESIYYRNAKWMKELTKVGSDDHVQITTLMHTLARVVGT